MTPIAVRFVRVTFNIRAAAHDAPLKHGLHAQRLLRLLR